MSLLRKRRASRRDQACADALLEACRPLDPLPPAAHARVKGRLKDELVRRPARAFPWVQAVVVGVTLLICGAAFGIAIDRLVLKRRPSVDTKATTDARAGRTSAGRAKHAPALTAKGATSADETTPQADAPHPGEVPPLVSAPVPAATVGEAAARGPSPARVAAPRKLALRDTGLTSPNRPSETPQPRAYSGTLVAPEAPAVQPAVPAPAAVKPAAQSVIPPMAVSAASTQPAALSEERLLAIAVRALRAEKDAGSALWALDEYQAHHQHGRLAVEASILRVDALTALGRRDETLRILDGLDLARVPGGIERQLQRGELRAQVGRWQEARTDYEGVLAQASQRDSGVMERACWGRVQAWRYLGNRDEVRAGAALYLRRFPHGQFAAQAELWSKADSP
jgi:hypothetical protein